jgi:hypothetical protein
VAALREGRDLHGKLEKTVSRSGVARPPPRCLEPVEAIDDLAEVLMDEGGIPGHA